MHLTFKGKRSYQTNIGAFISIIIKIILSLFIGYQFYVVFWRKHPAVSVKEQLNLNPEMLGVKDMGFEMGFGLSQINTNNRTNFNDRVDEFFLNSLDPLFGRIKATVLTENTSHNIPLIRCNQKNLGFNLKQNDSFYCLSEDYDLKGHSFYTSEYSIL